MQENAPKETPRRTILTAIRNPIEWAADELNLAARYLKSVGRSIGGGQVTQQSPSSAGDDTTAPERPALAVREIQVADLREVLNKGLEDFGACRSDVVFICLLYPVIGVVLATFAFNYNMLQLLFPLAAGFALIGPVAAIGLYELSRRREQGRDTSFVNALGVVYSPSLGAIVTLGLVLLAIFLAWMAAAQAIYAVTLGPEPPASLAAFASDVFTTPAGWAMTVVGVGVGFLFAVLVLAISVVSFPLLLDRNVGVTTAVSTSVRAVLINPVPMAAWGLIVVGGLVLGSLPLFVGLIIVLPVLGHATWHLYRKVVV